MEKFKIDKRRGIAYNASVEMDAEECFQRGKTACENNDFEEGVEWYNLAVELGGTGAMALEALSRGAEHAVIVDSGREAIRAIERNSQSVLKDAMPERVKILRADYRAAIDAMRDVRFDLVFLDPPYRMADAYADALTRLCARGLLGENCICLLERAADAQISLPDGFERYDTRTYGGTSVEFVREAR